MFGIATVAFYKYFLCPLWIAEERKLERRSRLHHWRYEPIKTSSSQLVLSPAVVKKTSVTILLEDLHGYDLCSESVMSPYGTRMHRSWKQCKFIAHVAVKKLRVMTLFDAARDNKEFCTECFKYVDLKLQQE